MCNQEGWWRRPPFEQRPQRQISFEPFPHRPGLVVVLVAASTSLLPLLLSSAAPSPPASPAPPLGIALVEPELEPLCRQGRGFVFGK